MTIGRRLNTCSSRRVSSGNGFAWLLVALPLLLLVLGAGFNTMLFREQAPFVVATAARSDAMCMADGNATRVAAHVAHVVAGTRASVPRIKIANARTRARMKDSDSEDVLAGGPAQKVHVPFWKICARTAATTLPVKIRALRQVHVFLRVNLDDNTTRRVTAAVYMYADVCDGCSKVRKREGKIDRRCIFFSRFFFFLSFSSFYPSCRLLPALLLL